LSERHNESRQRLSHLQLEKLKSKVRITLLGSPIHIDTDWSCSYFCALFATLQRTSIFICIKLFVQFY